MSTWTTEDLNDYLDDRLKPLDRARVAGILGHDMSAAELLRELQQLRNQFRGAPRYRLDKGFPARVTRQLDGHRPRIAADQDVELLSPASVRRGGRRVWRHAAVAISALTAALLLIVLVRPVEQASEVASRTSASAPMDKKSESMSIADRPPGKESVDLEPGRETQDALVGADEPSGYRDSEGQPVQGRNNWLGIFSKDDAGLRAEESAVLPDDSIADRRLRDEIQGQSAARGESDEAAPLAKSVSPHQYDDIILVTTTADRLERMIVEGRSGEARSEDAQFYPGAELQPRLQEPTGIPAQAGEAGDSREKTSAKHDLQEKSAAETSLSPAETASAETRLVVVEASSREMEALLDQLGQPVIVDNEQTSTIGGAISSDASLSRARFGEGGGDGAPPGNPELDKDMSEGLASDGMNFRILEFHDRSTHAGVPAPDPTPSREALESAREDLSLQLGEADSPGGNSRRRFLLVLKIVDEPAAETSPALPGDR